MSAEMNGIQSKRAQNIEKSFPGCLGRMIVSDLRRSSSNKKANGTLMKTLIAQEMSKEVVSKHNPPNVVAKLMGLDTLPYQQPNQAAKRSHSRDYSRRSLSHSGSLMECWEQESGFIDRQMPSETHHYQDHNEYKDVYEIWQQTQKTIVRDSSPQKGSYIENASEKKMALVRQKFMEAKRLSTDEKGRQSKEFEDALEVLTSNKDMFLKFLQEPNSLFSQRPYDIQSIPQSPETKRITVLKPSKMVHNDNSAGSGKKIDKKPKKPAHMDQPTGWDRHNSGRSPVCPSQMVDNYPSQPTRIVVLRPSPGKMHDIRAVVSPPSSSPRIQHGEDLFSEHEDDEAKESRELAKEITRQMRENLMGHRRDETLLSSVYSNGYIGDDSSFNKSEIDYAVGNASDSEIMSPTSRHSWDYINRFGSPYSSSSFSRASCSPESSVCREAKKRLSERWAMMASNGRSQTARRSSSTLGEMLALSDTKKSLRSEEPRGSTSCLSNLDKEEESMPDSPKGLLRSKSVPVSNTGFATRLSVEISDAETGRVDVPKELTKTKSMKSSLKGKVSSLFFSKSKKSSREKSGACQSKDECQSATSGVPGSPLPVDEFLRPNSSEDCSSPGLRASSSNSIYSDLIGAEKSQGSISLEGGLSVAKRMIPGSINENQDQPSPISVLEPPFDEDDITVPEPSDNIKSERRGMEVSLKSNLIDKSPPIESIARTLSWEESCIETATPFPLKSPSLSGAEEEEKDWFFLVKTLLSQAGVDGEVQSKSCFARWHSPESPLEPSLRDKYANNMNDKEIVHEAKRRQRRSNRKLVFDCVNSALVEIISHGSDRNTRATSCSGAHNVFTEGAETMLVDNVWAQMKGWFCSEVKCTGGDGGDSNSLVVEMVVRKEVVGKGWVDNMRAELDNLGNEIEEKMLEELVEEAVAPKKMPEKEK
ncbi:hypothetical protein Tsubulata_012044 [Turnera subulata]|uniref:DUF3741 domain-containing protein n=1 Tax=Turnera subulata TaxID=218843 RepID=A0A9Q0GGQ3_9ROSI|nr:hypothetical protein Tsubulata_012044 [Turnera subulata]